LPSWPTRSARAAGCSFLPRRNQLALRYHFAHRDVGAFVEELGRGKRQHAVVFGHDQEAALVQQTAVRLLNFRLGANDFTSVATSPLLGW